MSTVRTIAYVTVSTKYAVPLDLPEDATDGELYEEACTRIESGDQDAFTPVDSDTTLESIDRKPVSTGAL